jgi:hypothetical protein
MLSMNPAVNAIHISPTDVSQKNKESGGAFFDPIKEAQQTTK